MVCIFCLKETDNSITLHGTSELAKQARNVVTKHFWFDPNEINSMGKCACSYCWSQVESFSDFYGMVVSNYPNFLNVIDETKHLVNPSLDSDPLSFVNEIDKVEHDELDFHMVDYESEQVLSLSNSVDVKIETDEMADNLAEEPNVNSDAIQLPNRRSKSAKKGNSDTQSGKPKVRKRRKAVKLSRKVCHKQYSDFGLRYHMAAHDPEESFILECDECGKKFSRKHILRDHLQRHARWKNCDRIKLPVPCPICKKVVARNNVKAHISRMHENKKLPLKCVCTLCGKGFSAPSLLAKHALIHLDRSQTQVQCDFCGKWQKNELSLLAHKKTHREEPQKCPHPNCDTLAYSSNELKIHISQFHTNHKHQCSICKKSFRVVMGLREHIAAAHTGERAYKCLYCTKDFAINSSRFRHMKRLHPNEYGLDRDRRKSK